MRHSKPTANSQSGNHSGNELSKKSQKSRDTDKLSREKLTTNERSFLTTEGRYFLAYLFLSGPQMTWKYELPYFDDTIAKYLCTDKEAGE